MPVTRKDIARELNVSDSLVGKVLNGSANVWASPELCERIRKTALERGYRPNAAAQALARGRTNLVAVWTIRLDLYVRHVTQLQALAQTDGYEVLVRQVEYSPAEWNWPADGIICVDAPHRLQQYLKEARQEAIPIVNFGVEECAGVDQSLIDLVPGTNEAMLHFARRGCRRIAYLLSEHAILRLDDGRRLAYEASLQSRGLSPELIVADDMSAAAAYAAMLAHLQQHGAPQALLIFASTMVPGALQALRAIGARVPEEVSLVTIDNTPELAFLGAPISAVEVPIEAGANAAWELLRHRMKNPGAPRQRQVKLTRFVDRESSSI